ncbi:MAG: lipopolysaccharide assembly protein LapA domain-containing protein [Gammaproteobacteria bacterium]|jgi:uncharacterized integral membrane protein|nr:lipopolysaccharide assembly protein LapA domain-containing protein [Xanthomonadaceae bacterium]
MRALKAIIALLFVLAGITLGALNQQTISIDLFFVRYQAHLGLALLLCVLAGAVIGGALASISLLTDKRSLPKPVKAASEGGNSA